ncbi:uncharacterized protein EAF02_009751 [Botrytis sinoallii]|uniref:uncharacterized protein n=1 Tax=Botrytis sinoallii TaxID=1463999 RepID=UPI001900BB59|nr:uncharacterized protein EAF02_009751 [Botrytis sinoallii]KAF7867560.1 hypothetical protein EAF02_009751 [Botrytis sinoallii]
MYSGLSLRCISFSLLIYPTISVSVSTWLLVVIEWLGGMIMDYGYGFPRVDWYAHDMDMDVISHLLDLIYTYLISVLYTLNLYQVKRAILFADLSENLLLKREYKVPP